ncbi:MAG: glycosyltransferase family 2 protein, partial [Chlamydiia bacterium]|nr:glycosyltransferase family 2 protein [Chlamydiia bacterium]
LGQKYKNYRVIYINDCSPDGTGAAVEAYLQDRGVEHRTYYYPVDEKESIEESTENFRTLVNEERPFFILVNNTTRQGALANLYRAIYSCDDDEIVVTVDGDDWLYHKRVLFTLEQAYNRKIVWMTHGRFVDYPHGNASYCLRVPPSIVKNNTFRSFRCPTHLRTFYAWLFKKIKLEDLLYEGKFYVMTWDMAMMYPMIEMAGERHAFVENINYVYNMANQINDNKVNAELQRQLDHHIRALPPYERLP